RGRGGRGERRGGAPTRASHPERESCHRGLAPLCRRLSSSATRACRRSESIGLRRKPSTPAAKASRLTASSFCAVTTTKGIERKRELARTCLHKSSPLAPGI